MNERVTENIVRSHFQHDPMAGIMKLEEQKSSSDKIAELLKNASKSKTGKIGRPEFIISFPVINSNYLIVVECKSDTAMHESDDRDDPAKYAVDGVIHYGKILSAEFDVISIAISGTTKETAKISSFLHKNKEIKELADKMLLTVNDYLAIFDDQHFLNSIKDLDVRQKASYLNNELNNCSIAEYQRCTIISSILIALQDSHFRHYYSQESTIKRLSLSLVAAIERELKSDDVKNSENMLGVLKSIEIEPLFREEKITIKQAQTVITIEKVKELISYIDNNLYPLIKYNRGNDILGRFYTEFIRYAGGKGKQGLVLTPSHLTDLFCDLANLSCNNTLYDPCCGTGGFLVSGMKRMIDSAGNNQNKIHEIKKNRLIGCEIRPDMATYASTNMMFRGDGKSNIYTSSCFTLDSEILKHSIDTVFLNPPYDVGTAGQMEFIEHGLKMIRGHGSVVAIVQMSCAIKREKRIIEIKERLLNKHKLKAVISMPDDVFYPVGVVTCIMVWEANIPNKEYKTWFGYLKDDGFEKRKHKGRVDVNLKWDAIKASFLDAYRNSEEIAGLSVKKEVTATDEWCAEAYMETDYSSLNDDDFINTIKKYIAYQLMR